MAGFNLGHWLEERIADVNPFDNGATAKTVQAKRAKPAPAQTIPRRQPAAGSLTMGQPKTMQFGRSPQPSVSLKPQSLPSVLSTPKIKPFAGIDRSEELKPKVPKSPLLLSGPGTLPNNGQKQNSQPNFQKPSGSIALAQPNRQNVAPQAPASKPMPTFAQNRPVMQFGQQDNSQVIPKRPLAPMPATKSFGEGVADFGKQIVSGLQQAPANVADIALMGVTTIDSIGKNDADQLKVYEKYNKYRNWIKAQKTINGESLNPNKEFEFTGDAGRDAATLAGRGLGVGLDATTLLNPGRLVAGKAVATPTAKELAKFAGRDAAFYGTGAGLATGAQTYGETGDLEQALNQGAQGAALSAVTQGGLDIAGHALGRGARGVSDGVESANRAAKTQVLKLSTDSTRAVPAPTSLLRSYEGAPDRVRVEEYKAQIMNGGAIEPLIVMRDSDGAFSVEDGKHRLQAYQELGIKNVPVKVATPEGVKKIIEGGFVRLPDFGGASDDAAKGIPKQNDASLPAEMLDLEPNRQSLSSDNSIPRRYSPEALTSPVQPRVQPLRVTIEPKPQLPALAQEQRLMDIGGGEVKSVGTAVGNPSKTSRYASRTIPGSEFVGETVSNQTKQNAPNYIPETERGRYEQTFRSAEQMGVDDFENNVFERLDSKNIDSQTVADSQAVAQGLEAKGDDASLRRAAEIYDKVSEHLTRSGQTVQAAAIMSRRTPQGIQYQALKDIRKAGIEITPEIQRQIKSRTELIAQTKPKTEQRAKALGELAKEVEAIIPNSTISNLVSVWKAGLLSGVKTTQGNIVSNAAFAGLKSASSPITILADEAMSFITGKRTAPGTLKGVASGTKEGIRKGAYTLKTGIDLRTVKDKYENQRGINFKNKTVQKVLGTPAQKIFDFMGAQDQPFYFAQLKNSLYDLAKADGLNKGLTGQNLSNHMDELVNNPTETILQRATDEASKAVLGYDTVAYKAIQGAKQSIDNMPIAEPIKKAGVAVIDILAPFTRVPTAFLSRSIDYTPLGIGKTALVQIANKQFDQRALSQAIGEGITGTGVIVLGSALANTGQVSGDYPTSPKEQQRWKSEGIQPNSVKLGDKWVSLNYLGPVGMLFGAGKKFADSTSEGESKIASTGAAIGGFGQTLLGQSFLQGLSGFMDATKDPKRYLENFIEGQSGSIIPSFVNDFANLTDSYKREVNGPVEAIQNRIPGARQSLDAKQDVYGNKLQQDWLETLTAARARGGPSNDVITEVGRLAEVDKNNPDLQVTPTPVDKTITVGDEKVKLDSKQRYELQEKVGQMTQDAWGDLIKTDKYKSLGNVEKAEALNKLRTDVTAVAKSNYANENKLGEVKLSGRQKAMASGMSNNENYLSETSGGSINLASNLDTSSTGTLNKYNSLDSTGREKWFNTEKDAEYKYELAKYKNDKANGSISDIEDLKYSKSLKKDKVGSSYSKDARDLYSMSKASIYEFVSKSKDGKKLAEELFAYDKALNEAGLTSYLKFKTGIAPAARGRKSTGRKVGKRKSAKGKSAKGKFDYKLFGFSGGGQSNSKQLHDILKKARMNG